MHIKNYLYICSSILNIKIMEFKGTKGKWKSVNLGSHWDNKDIDNIQIQYGEDGECVSDHVYCEYDALLISKAPDLLDFIKRNYTFLNITEQKEAIELIKQATTL